MSRIRTRAEIIQGFAFGLGRRSTAPFDEGDGADSQGYEPKPYDPEDDGGDTVKCPDCGKLNASDAKHCDQCGFKLEGSPDVKDTADDAGGDEGMSEESDAESKPPVDEQGNVDPEHKCATDGCGHLASVHADTGDGKNTGACANCSCAAMDVGKATAAPEEAEGEGEGEPAKPGARTAAAPPAAVEPDEADEAEPAPTEDGGANTPPEVEGGENMGPAFTIPVLIIEGQPTGDGRMIAKGALDWRTPPLPLMGLKTETHDPNGFDMNAPAVMCGRIDSLSRAAGEGDTEVISAHGYFLPNDDGAEFAELAEAFGRIGVSGDVAVEESEITVEEVDEIGFPTEMSDELLKGTIMGCTIVPFPAFEGAYLVLGDGADVPEAKAPPQAAESPEAVTAGGQLINWLTYDQCEACDQGLEVITAAGGPERPPKAWFDDPGFKPDDGRLREIHGRNGKQYACPLTVTADGRVYGHIAPWNVCHTGKPGQCITAPHSSAGYAFFKRGQHLTTAEGEKVSVGTITADAGHAGLRLGATAAMAHYDDTALACADVNAGEDEYGIWVAGAIRPDATEAQVRKLTASSISGDWREVGGSLELVAALAVPMPGFPLAVVAGGHIESLTAAGAGAMQKLKADEPEPESGAWADALRPLLGMAKTQAVDRLGQLTPAE